MQILEDPLTYEAAKARQSTQTHADKIHWDASTAFRDCPYRQLHHQRGWIGSFRVRLLEASDLQRSYWSALAMGPVKHLGFSKAHGAVSAYCTFTLDFEANESAKKSKTPQREDLDKKPAARNTVNSSSNKSKQYSAASPVVQSDNSPVWENCQFDFPLRKGAMPTDGMRIMLKIRVDEDATAVENLIPGIPSGGDARLLGVGALDLTELCLGETVDGQPLPGVRDVWVPISMKGQEVPEDSFMEEFLSDSKDDPLAPPVKKDVPKPPPVTGMVRVLVSYQPHGLEPQQKDIVALEAFARRSPSNNSCRPLLSPLMPLTVLERRGAYLLCEYRLADERKACVRLHRNAVFVVERQNLVDAAQNLALLPFDVMAATPVGQATGHVLGPVVAASRELLMPALLSFKLVWVAARTTTLAGISGISAVGTTMWDVGSSSLTHSHRRDDLYVPRDDENRQQESVRAATAKFVSL